MQTEIQKPGAIRSGSIVLEVGPTLQTLVNVGALRDITLNQTGETQDIEFDNADKLRKFINGDQFALGATLAEIDWGNIGIMNDGQVNITSTPGSAVNGATQLVPTLEWAFDRVIELDGQNADGSAPTINSVTGSSDGATSDYTVVKLPNGKWGVSITSGGALSTENQDVTIDTDYTPAALRTVTFNQNGRLVEKFMRITNTDENGRTQVFILSGVTNVSPIELDFAGDEEADVATLPVSLEGRLVRIEDQQSTT
jgi:hypothetical protein